MQIFSLILLHLVVIKISSSSLPTVTTAQRTSEISERKTRKPCGFFVWDGMSASRYHVCKRLLRESVYEGLGGKKFLRMRQGSVLASLYPLSKHGPDRCLICGQSFNSHLMSWWFSRRYTPYDLYLDHVKEEGSTSDSHLDAQPAVISHGRRKNKSNDDIAESSPNVLAYHRLYSKSTISTRPPSVVNLNTKDTKRKDRKRYNNTSDLSLLDNHEMRESGGIQYAVPKVKTDDLGVFRSAVLTLAREIVLTGLDDLLFMQRLENNFNEWRERFNPDLILR